MGVGIGRYSVKLHLASLLMVQSLDNARHGQDIARAQHTSGVQAELLDGQDRHKLLRAWLREDG